MPSLVEFLNHVLPSEGYYCWWYKDKSGRPQQGFTSTIEQLAAALVQIDALGCDAFFACSTYKEPTSRRSENVKRTKSFWLDIDAGPNKPYPNAEAALSALDDFCERAGWQQPTVVYSGGGIHAYWNGPQEFDPVGWLASARLLKSTIASYGLEADPSRTADISSILRPPSTFNWKIPNTPRPVVCDELMDSPMPLRGVAIQSSDAAPTRHDYAPASTADLTKNVTAIYGPREPSYASVAVSQCNQLRHFRDTRGNISEPLWYAGLGLLAQCEDGSELAHEWSSGHPTYSRAETDRKFNQAKNAAGATTCQQFKSVNPAGCVGCPFTITSPIILGRAKPAQAAPLVTETFPELPPGYTMNHKYQLCVEIKWTDEKGLEKKWNKPFTKCPIYLSEVRNGETETKQGFFFRQWEQASGWCEFEISAKSLTSMGSWGELADHGAVWLDPENRKHFMKYIDASHTLMTGAKKMRYDQFGWKDNFTAYYYGGYLYKNDGTITSAAGSPECTKRGDKMKPSKQGSLEAWSAAANKLFVDGCEAQSFALLASFASPLMAFITPPGEGGAVLSLVSPTGGTGKSTALTAVASVWGELEAIRLISRDTMTSKFRIIGTLNTKPIVFDELRERHPEIIVEFMQSYTTGRDRNRARIDGSINPIEFSWKNILVSASNKSLVDAINSAENASTDAMADRVFEVEMKKPKDVVFSHNGAIGNELILNRGHAGKAYITYLLQPGMVEWCRVNLLKLVDHYTQVTGASTCHRYMIREVAACALAGLICKKLGLMEFSVERIINWALEEVKERVKDMPKFEPWQSLVNIINENAISSCVVVDRRFNPNQKSVMVRAPRFDTHMRYEVEDKRLYISADWIRGKLNEMGQPALMVIKDLEAKGILLQRNRRTSFNAGLDLPGGKVPCWEVDMTHSLMADLYIKEVLPTSIKIA